MELLKFQKLNYGKKTIFDKGDETIFNQDYVEQTIIDQNIYKFNYFCMYGYSKNCVDLEKIIKTEVQPHKFDYYIAGSFFMSYLYNKNIVNVFNEHLKYNKYNVVQINNDFAMNMKKHKLPNSNDSIDNGLWNTLKNIPLGDLINSYDIDVHVYPTDNINYSLPGKKHYLMRLSDKIIHILTINSEHALVDLKNDVMINNEDEDDPTIRADAGSKPPEYEDVYDDDDDCRDDDCRKKLKGGYLNIRNAFTKLGYMIETKGKYVAFYRNIFNIGDSPYVRIYYKITDMFTHKISHVNMFDIFYETPGESNSNQYIIKYKNQYYNNVALNKNYPLKNIMSLYDIINNYYFLSKLEKYKKRNKAIFRLYFLLNMFFNESNGGFQHNNIYRAFTGSAINTYIDDIDKLGIEICRYIKNDMVVQDSMYNILYYEIDYDLKTNSIFSIDKLNSSIKIFLGKHPGNMSKMINKPVFFYKKYTDGGIDIHKNYNNNTIFDALYDTFKMLGIPSGTLVNFKSFTERNYLILGGTGYTGYTDMQQPNSIIAHHIDYISKNSKWVKAIKTYSGNNYLKMNNMMFKMLTHETNDIGETIKSFDSEDQQIVKNIYNLYLCLDSVYDINMLNQPNYILTVAEKGILYNSGAGSNILMDNLNIGESIFIPYFMSTTIKLENVAESFSKSLGYKIFVIVPTTEKYLTIFGKPAVSTIPYEEEILLPPGYFRVIKFMADYTDDANVDKCVCIMLYQSCDLGKEITSYHSELAKINLTLSINSQITPNNDSICSKMEIMDIDKKNMIYYRAKDDHRLFMSNGRNILKMSDIDINYVIYNISPYNNIFNSKSILIPNDKNGFYGITINFKTRLYRGSADIIPDLTGKHIFFSHLFLASGYGLTTTTNKNLYTLLFDGTISDIKLIDIFCDKNISVIQTYYNTATLDEKKVLNRYMKLGSFSEVKYTTDTIFYPTFFYNSKEVRIKYRDVIYSKCKSDFSKYSKSTEHDIEMADLLLKIFGSHDGYISKCIPSLVHLNGVFDDELCIYDMQKFTANKTITLLHNKPTTIINGEPPTRKQLYIRTVLQTIRNILKRVKCNRIIDTMNTSFFFDNHISISEYPYEKYFINIAEMLKSDHASLHRGGGSSDMYIRKIYKYLKKKNSISISV